RFDPGSHGSTFSGHPIACELNKTVNRLMKTECMSERSAEHGARMMRSLQNLDAGFVTDLRGKGLWIGVQLASEQLAHDFCARMVLNHHILCKDAHGAVRISPPFTSTQQDIDLISKAVLEVEKEMRTEMSPRIACEIT